MKLENLLENCVKEYFNTDEIKVITINSYNHYKEGMYWDNLDDFINDDDIKVNDNFIESYVDDLMDCIQNYDDLSMFDLDDRLEQLFADEDYFIILDELVLEKMQK